jgi:predicted alpha/beta superfamily hydrolase
VVGTLLESDEVRGVGIVPRRLLALLPRSYEASSRSYPVLYMHDGDNLFDEPASFAGEWRVDETMDLLADEGIEAIIVGIPNAGRLRMREYVPWTGPDLEGKGEDYLRFVIDVVKPRIDASFRTERGPRHTGLMGSSLGGLISLFGVCRHPDVFGFAGVMSPALSWPDGEVFPFLETAPCADARIYMDVGTKEIPGDPDQSAAYVAAYDRAVAILQARGATKETFRTVIANGASHDERAWARRLPGALRFLLGGIDPV